LDTIEAMNEVTTINRNKGNDDQQQQQQRERYNQTDGSNPKISPEN
jgi:hypothetical protein